MFKTKIDYGNLLYDQATYGFEIRSYYTNYNEFFMMKVIVSKPHKKTIELTYSTPAIIFVYTGEGAVEYTKENEKKSREIKIKSGESYFILPGTHLSIKSYDNLDEPIVIYICSSQNK